MAADLTTLARVEAGWRQTEDGSQEQLVLTTLISAASRLLRRLVPTVDARIGSGDLDVELVSDIVSAAVIRVMRNPDGIRETSIDDYREVRDRDLSAGLLQFLDAELALLEALGTSGAFTIRPAGSRPCW